MTSHRIELPGSAMTASISTIFFDVGNTLLFPDRRVVLAPLRERAMEAPLQLWHAIERRTKPQFDQRMKDGGVDLGFWSLFHANLLQELGMQDEALHQALVAAMRVSAHWTEILPGTRERLDQFGERFRIGVISNADGKILSVLKTCGIAGCFRSITDSGLVGYEKPRPEIFHEALRQMGARAEECMYVGDVYSVDYLGATNVGMQAMLFDVAGAYRDSGLPRVESLEELQNRLAE